jgi:hypothetical protein
MDANGVCANVNISILAAIELCAIRNSNEIVLENNLCNSLSCCSCHFRWMFQ